MNIKFDYDYNKKYINFNNNWKFKEDEKLEIEDITKDIIKDFEDINLPHDWSIYKNFNQKSLSRNEGGLLDGGIGWYLKEIDITDKLANKEIFIKFGGIYMDSHIYINGALIGNYPSGYTSFIYDITEYLRYGKNIIAIKVVHKQASSRWYSGSGIYRNVELILRERIFIEDYSTVICTPDLKDNLDNARTNIKFNIKNKSKFDENLRIQIELLDSKGNKLNEKEFDYKINGNVSIEFNEDIYLSNPELWSVEDPNLYFLKASIYIDDKLIDEEITRFGYRYYDWTKEDGFSLNGKYLKFHGVCLHHDNGALGAELYTDADRRKLQIMKDMGVNAIRTSHNPQSEEFIRLCDEMGFLVQEEAFDTWYGNRKKDFDYNRFFNKLSTHPEANLGETWAEFDIKQMVRRDINSPSIIMWSIGNEIFETEQVYGLEQGQNLIKWIKEIDDTRYVTIGENSLNWNRDKEAYHVKIASLLDVVGLNYNEAWSDELYKDFDWILYGAETSSAVKSRGVFYNPEERSNIATGDSDKVNRKYQMSDYGNDRVGWGSTSIDSWIHDRDRKYYAGQFIWTGFDYIGEPTPWHNEENLGAPVKSSFFGIVDTAGIPKMDYYFYQSQWFNQNEKKVLKILPHWNFEDRELLKEQGTDIKRYDNKIPVRVYSNLDSVELFLNNKSLGKKSFNKKTTDYGLEYLEGDNPRSLYLEWLVEYEEGELKAIAKDNEGNIIEDIVKTSGKATGIKLSPYNEKQYKDSIEFIRFDIVDNEGNIVPTAENEVEFEIKCAEIIGVDNGNAASQERYKKQADGRWIRKAFSGSGIVIIKLSDEKNVELIAKSNNLSKTKLIFNLAESKVKEFYDGLRENIAFEELKDDNSELIELEEINISTQIDEEISLPEKIKGQLENRNKKYIDVSWEDIDSISQIGIYKVQGETKNKMTNANIVVNDFVAIENFSMAIKEHSENIELPLSANIYNTSGEIREVEILEWINKETNEELKSSDLVKDKIINLIGKTYTKFESNLSLRIVDINDDSIVESYNYARVWNGSEIPAGIASYTSDLEDNFDSTIALNNEIISYDSKYMDRWSNLSKEKRDKDFAGILFGRAGELSKHQINKLEVIFYEDEEVSSPKEFKIEYYDSDEVSIPKDYSNIGELNHELNDDANWKEIKKYRHKYGQDEKFNIFEFDEISTYAIRINMIAKEDKVLGITEIKVYGSEVKAFNDFELDIKVDGHNIEFNKDQIIYELDKDYKNLEIKANNNASITKIPGIDLNHDIEVIVKSEDKFTEKKYIFRRKND